MNVNQQNEIEDLFKRINRNISKNPNSKIEDLDLEKMTHFQLFFTHPQVAEQVIEAGVFLCIWRVQLGFGPAFHMLAVFF